MPGPNPEPPPPGYVEAEVARTEGTAERLSDELTAEIAAELVRQREVIAYREAHERALAAARGGEEVLSVRTELDDAYLDALEVAITPPNGPLVTRVFRYAEAVDGEPTTPDDVLGRIALWKVDVRGDDVQLLIDEVRRLRAAATPVVQGWWHPNVKSGQVHDHTAVQPQTMHRLCRPITLAPEARS